MKKTKEMLFGSIQLNPQPLILINDCTVERVTSFELLGLTIANNLCWEEPITNVYNKASKRLHYPKLLSVVWHLLTIYSNSINLSFGLLSSMHALYGNLVSLMSNLTGLNRFSGVHLN